MKCGNCTVSLNSHFPLSTCLCLGVRRWELASHDVAAGGFPTVSILIIAGTFHPKIKLRAKISLLVNFDAISFAVCGCLLYVRYTYIDV